MRHLSVYVTNLQIGRYFVLLTTKASGMTTNLIAQAQTNDVTDFIRCDAQGIEPVDCPTFQVENFTGGNPDLQAEEAESTNIGVVLSPVEGLRVSFDYFEVDTTDRATSLSLARLLSLAAAGTLPPGTAVNRGPGEAAEISVRLSASTTRLPTRRL